MRKRGLAVGVSAVVLLFSLGAGSASATILPFFLTLNGTNEGTVAPGFGSTVYQLWVDPSAISGGTFGIDATIVSGSAAGSNSLTMTNFTAVFAGTTGNLTTATRTLSIVTGDPTNGNFVPFEIGTVTIANTGSGADYGDVTLWSGDYVDSNFSLQPATTPRLLAAIIPEPTTGLLVLTGVLGLAVRRRHARGASRGERASV